MTYDGQEKGVHPVIGVILIIAITVVLAGVIAAFVFGMAGQTTRNPDPYNQTVTVAIGDKGFSDSVGFYIKGADIHSGLITEIFFIPEEGYKLSTINVGEVYRVDIRKDYYIPSSNPAFFGGTVNWRVVNMTRISYEDLPQMKVKP